MRIIFERLKLTLHPEKTRKVDLTDGKEGFDFLGCHLHKRMSGKLLEKKRHPPVLPAAVALEAKSMKRVREKIHDLTDRSRNGVKDVKVIIDDLNPVLRGWGNYFRTGNAARKFNQLDGYVVSTPPPLHGEAPRAEPPRRAGGRVGRGSGSGTRACTDCAGPFATRSRACCTRRPPVSRVREIRTHGLKGGGWKRAA